MINMEKSEFIAKLQMCYFGDRNAFNEIIEVYDELKKDTINDILAKDYNSCVKDLKKSEKKREKLEKENQRLKDDIKILLKENEAKEKVIIKYNNVLNELKEWFKEFHKYHSRLRWNEVDYIEFIEHLENELKESDK